jgi:hypothetical protein
MVEMVKTSDLNQIPNLGVTGSNPVGIANKPVVQTGHIGNNPYLRHGR